MSNNHEVQRLIATYRKYGESRAIQANWSMKTPGNQAMVHERMCILERMLKAAGLIPLTHQRILDVGCGYGGVLASLTQWGARPDHLYGVDSLRDLIEKAHRKFPTIHYLYGNAEQLGFREESFDIVLLFTVFSSILDAQMASNVAAEVCRVLKPGGRVVWYDLRYNNPSNPNIQRMTKGAVRKLFPHFDLHLRTVTLLPPLARRLGRATPLLYPALAGIPFLRTHYVGWLIKRQ